MDSDGTLNYFKNNAEGIELKTEGYTVTITSDDYAPISAPLTVRQYLYAGSEEDLWVVLWGLRRYLYLHKAGDESRRKRCLVRDCTGTGDL